MWTSEAGATSGLHHSPRQCFRDCCARCDVRTTPSLDLTKAKFPASAPHAPNVALAAVSPDRLRFANSQPPGLEPLATRDRELKRPITWAPLLKPVAEVTARLKDWPFFPTPVLRRSSGRYQDPTRDSVRNKPGAVGQHLPTQPNGDDFEALVRTCAFATGSSQNDTATLLSMAARMNTSSLTHAEPPLLMKSIHRSSRRLRPRHPKH